MKQIRKSVFETNSSSVHAIVIHTDETIDLSEVTTITFSFDEFGWSNDKYYSIQNKADYLWTGINSYYNYSTMLDIKDRIESWFYEDKISCNFSEEIENIPWSQGYIDHSEDLGEFLTWILESKENLYQFLFTSGSFVETGNDNGENSRPYEGLRMQNVDGYLVFVK